MKYGLYCYPHSNNLGDDIQSIAAQRFLPSVDYRVDRDRLSTASAMPPLAIIFAGWHKWHAEDGNPPANIMPLFYSFHATEEYLDTPGVIPYLTAHQPIGCRDVSTMQDLQMRGVTAYFTGCITLTLEIPDVQRTGAIYAVDVDSALFLEFVPPRMRALAIHVTHSTTLGSDSSGRDREARRLLGLYASARLVITSRLHAALPCLAYGTPVVLVGRFLTCDRRLKGLSQYVYCIERHEDVPRDWDVVGTSDVWRPVAEQLKASLSLRILSLNGGERSLS